MKPLATLTAASLLALAGVAAVAQTSPPPSAVPPAQGVGPGTDSPPVSSEARRRPQLNATEMRAIVDARLAGVPTGLKLTPEQQRLWPSLEEALRGMASERIARMEERRNARAAAQPAAARDLAQRLDEGSRRATAMAQRLQSLSSAMQPFWASLTDDQKRILPLLIRPTRVREPRWRGERGERRRAMLERRWDHHGGPGPGDRGPGGMPGPRQ